MYLNSVRVVQHITNIINLSQTVLLTTCYWSMIFTPCQPAPMGRGLKIRLSPAAAGFAPLLELALVPGHMNYPYELNFLALYEIRVEYYLPISILEHPQNYFSTLQVVPDFASLYFIPVNIITTPGYIKDCFLRFINAFPIYLPSLSSPHILIHYSPRLQLATD